MGCDIHFHTEVKVNGRWEHYNQVDVDRDYWFFSLLCGVREEGNAEPFLGKPNNIMPEDANSLTKTLLDMEWMHSLCTFDSDMIKKFREHFEEHIDDKPRFSVNPRSKFLTYYVGYIDGNCWSDEWSMPEWVEDYRWIFAFDS